MTISTLKDIIRSNLLINKYGNGVFVRKLWSLLDRYQWFESGRTAEDVYNSLLRNENINNTFFKEPAKLHK